jgi:hypothetical protein
MTSIIYLKKHIGYVQIFWWLWYSKNMLHYKQLETKQNAHITAHAYDDIDICLRATRDEDFILYWMPYISIKYNERNDYHQTN